MHQASFKTISNESKFNSEFKTTENSTDRRHTEPEDEILAEQEFSN